MKRQPIYNSVEFYREGKPSDGVTLCPTAELYVKKGIVCIYCKETHG